MAIDEVNSEAQEYRVVLVMPGSSEVLAMRGSDGLYLPKVRVSFTDRPAEVLQKSIESEWGVSVYLTDYLPTSPQGGLSPCVIGEVLTPPADCRLDRAALEELAGRQMDEPELSEFWRRLRGESQTVASVGRIGWLDEAYRWAEDAIGAQLAEKETVEQKNMGGGFVLLRLQTLDGRSYWLKATSGPNRHELPVTKLISQFSSDTLPELIAFREDWNAWLMADAYNGHNSTEQEADWGTTSANAARSLAKLQASSRSHVRDLLVAGAFDQRPAMTEEISQGLFDYLDECMRLQQSRKSAPLDRETLNYTREAYLSACRELQQLEMPVTLLHGDLTGGNIVNAGKSSFFLDWCEAYIGFPIASLHHLKMYFERSGVTQSQIRQMEVHYRDEWSKWANDEFPKEALCWGPLMAAASALYGRGDWLNNEEERNRPARRSYSRTLARHMTRAAQGVAEGVVLCT